MSAVTGIYSTLVTSNLVNQVKFGAYNTVVTAETGDIGTGGGYQVKSEHGGFGCSNSGMYVELLDTIPWTNITYEVSVEGGASCWSFNHHTNGYGPSPGSGNMLAYSEASGDRISRPFNSWEVPSFQSHNRTFACDNNSDNFYHGTYQVGNPKTFFMQRRRNVNGSLAGPHIGIACVGAGSLLIRNIRIW
jgi:hypothetical protein